MNLPFYIARRYLFSKKSHNAVNIISMVSVCGVAVVTAALVCAMSVLNGFTDLTAQLFGYLDPEIKITPCTGKVFDPQDARIQTICRLPEIAHYSEVLQDNALIRYGGRQVIGTVKGVDASYNQLVSIDSVLVDGRFALREDVVDYATLGIGLAYSLGIRPGFSSPIEIYVPKRDERVNMSNPAASLVPGYAYIAGVFRINQQSYDETYMIVPLELARSLFLYEREVSALELKVMPNASVSAVKKHIQEIAGDNYAVQDRYEQQADAFKMMQVEKMMIFLILCFILAIALFNVVGSLSMLMVEKQEDVKTLRNMGADDRLIKRIFLFEGWMIAALGALGGIAAGLILCALQIHFGLIRLDQGGGNFIVDVYPVKIMPQDIVLSFATVLTIGFLSSLYAVRYLRDKSQELSG
ncbi:Lipoprotein-releasing system transmembrane protein lolE [Bacteroidales bacterium Barb4]|nr:Lipoprotein-releasing system transmembrane protein lolE [Bacteroidales bacterium Barb4]